MPARSAISCALILRSSLPTRIIWASTSRASRFWRECARCAGFVIMSPWNEHKHPNKALNGIFMCNYALVKNLCQGLIRI